MKTNSSIVIPESIENGLNSIKPGFLAFAQRSSVFREDHETILENITEPARSICRKVISSINEKPDLKQIKMIPSHAQFLKNNDLTFDFYSLIKPGKHLTEYTLTS